MTRDCAAVWAMCLAAIFRALPWPLLLPTALALAAALWIAETADARRAESCRAE